MKFYVIIYIDYKNEGSVITKGYYESLSEAKNNLKSYALEYVRLDGGERQEKIALQNNCSIDDIKINPNLNSGLYIQESPDSKIVHVYEKSLQTTGYIFSSVISNITKIGIFTITDIEFNVPERFSCGCNTPKSHVEFKKTNSTTKKNTLSFLNELDELIKKNPNIKPIKRKYKFVYGKRNADKPLSIPDDINKLHQSN